MAGEASTRDRLSNLQLAADKNSVFAMPDPFAGSKDSFWEYLGDGFDDGIEATRWNKSFPYQIIVVKRIGDGSYQQAGGAVFTLPIPPESMTLSTPFAITTNITLGGVIEEHNGAPVRTITFSGTTGVMPLRGAAEQRGNSAIDQVSAIFAGTVQGIQGTKNAALDLGSNITGTGGSRISNLVSDSDVLASGSDAFSRSSGYFQFRLLQNFIEKYISLKKTPDGKPFRLAVAIWKDEAVYLCTPQTFNLTRTAQDPFSYNYNITFKAWRRIKLSAGSGAVTQFRPTVKDPNALAKMLNTINDARRVLQKSRQTLLSISGDVDLVLFEPLRETALFVKDALGVPLAFADLPNTILQNAKSAILEWSSANDAVTNVFSGRAFKQGSDDARQTLKGIAGLASSVGKDETRAGDPPFPGHGTIAADPTANSVFNNPAANFDFLNSINLGEVNLPPAVLRSVSVEKDRIRQQKRLDFENKRDAIVDLVSNFASAVGLGNDTYSKTFGKETRPQIKAASQQDHDALFQLNKVIMEMNRLAATGEKDNRGFDSIDFVAGAAAQSGIPFVKPRSKFAVPFPYGASLETLSIRYLGTPDRWHEIAALNNLRAPYVDEEGFDLPLLINGNGSAVVVQDAFNLYVNQLVWLSSNSTSRTSRHITGIREVTPTEFVVTVDGDPDLSRFTTLASATLHAYLPGTVNSQMLIYIPSNADASKFDFKGKSIPGLNEFDSLFQIGGADLLLTQSNDLVVTPDGDQRLAVGLTNIVQDARIRLGIQRGKLLHHPSLGLDIQIGQSTADLDPNQLLAACKDLFSDDPSYIGVTGATVTKQGPVASIGIAISIAGIDQPIPLTVKVQP